MSEENVEMVRRHLKPYHGEAIAPILREAVDRFGTAPELDAGSFRPRRPR